MSKYVLIVALAVTAGCFTVKETEYPQISVQSLPEGADVSVSLQGFSAAVTEYMTVYGHETVWVSGRPRGRYGWTPGYHSTLTSATYVPRVRTTDFYLSRASTSMETAGFATKAKNPDYVVNVEFQGPSVTDSERMTEAGWMLLSLFTADYSVETWSAKLKIYDSATGKVVYHRDYTQRYEVTVWGPLPLLSPAGSSKNTANAMQSWCLTALTDRAVADAAAFLVSKMK